MPSVSGKFLLAGKRKSETQNVVDSPEQQSFDVYRQLENRFLAAMHESESSKSASQSPPPPKDRKKNPLFFRKKNTRGAPGHTSSRPREAYVLHSTVSQAVIVPPKPTACAPTTIDVEKNYPYETEEEKKIRRLSTKVDDKFVDAVSKRVSKIALRMVEQRKKNDKMWEQFDKTGQQEAIDEAKAVLAERAKDLLKQRTARDVDKDIASRPIWTSSGNKHIHTAAKPQAELKVSFAFHRKCHSSDASLSPTGSAPETYVKKSKELGSKKGKTTDEPPDESEKSSDSISTPMLSSASVSSSASGQTHESSSVCSEKEEKEEK